MIYLDKNILLVDDDELLLETFKMFLGMEGYNVLAVSTPYKALQLIKENKVQLAILDYNLPNMNGVQLGRLIHKVQEEARIMFISGSPDIHVLVKDANYSVSTVLTKPIEIDHLISTVRCITGENISSQTTEPRNETSKIQELVRIFSISYREGYLKNLIVLITYQCSTLF